MCNMICDNAVAKEEEQKADLFILFGICHQIPMYTFEMEKQID